MAEPSGWPAAIRRLVADLSAAAVTEFEVRTDSTRLRIERQPGFAAAPATERIEDAPGVLVRAPLAGIFYRAQTPASDPFVRIGDTIEVGHLIGLIEAMKVFNEITAETGGRVIRFLADNGQLVQAGDGLIELEAE